MLLTPTGAVNESHMKCSLSKEQEQNEACKRRRNNNIHKSTKTISRYLGYFLFT